MRVMSDPIASRIQELVRQHGRELRNDILIRIVTGIAFSLLTFGFIFWFVWVFGFVAAYQLGLAPWQLAAAVTAVFFVAATASAWYRVDPLAAIRPMTPKQKMTFLVSRAVLGAGFSPQHAVGGAATALLGGPANFVQAIGIFGSRLGVNDAGVASAARLLDACRKNYPIENVKDADAAVLLRRLALIKFVPLDYSHRIALTEKAEKLLRAADKAGGKKSKSSER
jgi:hypothetical protein